MAENERTYVDEMREWAQQMSKGPTVSMEDYYAAKYPPYRPSPPSPPTKIPADDIRAELVDVGRHLAEILDPEKEAWVKQAWPEELQGQLRNWLIDVERHWAEVGMTPVAYWVRLVRPNARRFVVVARRQYRTITVQAAVRIASWACSASVAWFFTVSRARSRWRIDSELYYRAIALGGPRVSGIVFSDEKSLRRKTLSGLVDTWCQPSVRTTARILPKKRPPKEERPPGRRLLF